MDGFAKQLPKDLPKQKFRSWEGVVLSIVLYLILLGFVWFSIEMLIQILMISEIPKLVQKNL